MATGPLRRCCIISRVALNNFHDPEFICLQKLTINPACPQPRKFVREVGFRGEDLLHYNAIQCSGGVYIGRGFRKRIRAFSFYR
jgi:acyl CoA:acetate/3-ketoacid CoA transferase